MIVFVRAYKNCKRDLLEQTEQRQLDDLRAVLVHIFSVYSGNSAGNSTLLSRACERSRRVNDRRLTCCFALVVALRRRPSARLKPPADPIHLLF